MGRRRKRESYVAAVEQEINKYHRNLRIIYGVFVFGGVHLCVCFAFLSREVGVSVRGDHRGEREK